MDRDVELASKREEIQKELERWALENSLLECGEQIVFSVRIERVPLVVEEETENLLLDGGAIDFFSFGRCDRAGITKSVALSNLMKRSIRRYLGFSATLREFLETGPKEIRRWSGVGEKKMKEIERVLQMEGLSLLGP